MKRYLFVLIIAHLGLSSVALAVEDKDQLEALRAQATQGNVAAQYEMGVLYEFGFRMPDNLPHALAWYMVAAENGDERGIRRRDLLLGQLSAAQSDEARRLKSALVITPAASPPPAPPASTESAPTEVSPAPEPEKPATP